MPWQLSTKKRGAKFRTTPPPSWEPPDVGLAPTGVWRAPPPSPVAIGGPFPQAKALPSPPSPSLPPTPLGSFCKAPGRGGPVWSGGRGPRVQGGGEGRAFQRYLGPDPHLGVLDPPCQVKAGVVRSKDSFPISHRLFLYSKQKLKAPNPACSIATGSAEMRPSENRRARHSDFHTYPAMIVFKYFQCG